MSTERSPDDRTSDQAGRAEDQPPRPSIPLHHLARYMTSTPLQRRRIVERQKSPFAYADIFYEFAENAIVGFVMGGCQDDAILSNTIEELYSETPESSLDDVRLRANAEALEKFCESYEHLNLDGLEVLEGDREARALPLAGVDIVVRPDFVLRGVHRDQPIVGAVKLYFDKNDPLEEGTAAYLTSVVSTYTEMFLAGGSPTGGPKADVRSRRVKVYDIFAKQVHHAPEATTRRMQEVEAACLEIGLWWAALP